MKDANELRNGLANFYGTDGYHFNPLYRWMNYTDGVKFFAGNAGNGAYWLLDILGTELKTLSSIVDFLHIKFIVANCAGDIEVEDGNGQALWCRSLDYTDCPEGVWEFYLTNDVLLLPSEY